MGSEERYPTFQKYPDLFLKYQVHVWRIQHPSKWRTSSFSKKMYIFKHLTHIAFQLEIVLDFLKKWQFSRLDALSRPIKKLQRDPSDFEIKKMIINNFTYEECRELNEIRLKDVCFHVTIRFLFIFWHLQIYLDKKGPSNSHLSIVTFKYMTFSVMFKLW